MEGDRQGRWLLALLGPGRLVEGLALKLAWKGLGHEARVPLPRVRKGHKGVLALEALGPGAHRPKRVLTRKGLVGQAML